MQNTNQAGCANSPSSLLHQGTGEARVATSTGTSGDDRALSVMGSALRHWHRTTADGACVAGRRQQVPCPGQRLGTHALQAAGRPWHVQFSTRVDVLTSGIRHDG
ncbi:hypothetical protein GCM10027610_105690 [Dactylosporangium cerinum]